MHNLGRYFAWTFPRTLLTLAVACMTAAPAMAREITAQEAVAQVQQEGEGKLLSVQTLTLDSHKVYRIKLLTRDGRVRIVQVPAEQQDAPGGAAENTTRR